MECLDSFYVCLQELHHQVGILAGVVASLTTFLDIKADRLTREDGAQRLRTIYAAVAEELERTKRLEDTARYEDTKMYLPFSLAGFAAKLIAEATTENQLALNIVNQAYERFTLQNRSYGTVMVCVGPKGLPDDVLVVSISNLARESNQSESETIQKLQKAVIYYLARSLSLG